MKKLKTLAIGAIAVAALTACETTSSRPYAPSTKNVLAVQTALSESDTKVQLGPISAAESVNTDPTCRALGAIEVAPGQSPLQYIQEAFRQELFMSGAYDNSGTTISSKITKLEFNSFGTGSWDIELNVSSDALPEGFAVSTHYEFKTSFSAISACQNVIDAFNPAVSELLNKVVTNEKFSALAGK